jgi:hypothetical protein
MHPKAKRRKLDLSEKSSISETHNFDGAKDFGVTD